MSARMCVVCGRPAADNHHITSGSLDPELSFAHCHHHHEIAHDDWNTAGVPAKNRGRIDSDDDAPPTVLHALYLRLRRLGMWLGRLAEAGVWREFSAPLARAVATWADELETCVSALDGNVGEWRNAPGVSW